MNADRQEQQVGTDRTAGDVSTQVVSPTRRRLFKGAAGSAGVLLAVHAKTALGGGVCQSPSATVSGNTSPRPGSGTTCSGGRSPGFWKVPEHSGDWKTAHGVFPKFNGVVVSCNTTLNEIKRADIVNPGTTLQNVFLGWTPILPSGTNSSPISMWYVIYAPNDDMFGGPSGIGQLLRALSCAWLNAGYFTSSSALYPITRTQVIDMWTQLRTSGSYCPLSSCTKPWAAADVIGYIEGMYDDNAPVVNVCKQN